MKARAMLCFYLSALALSLSFAAPVSAQQPAARTEKLILAIQPTLATSELLEKAKPLEAALERHLEGVDVQIYTPMSYAAVVEALRFGHAHAALMGAWPAKLAERLAEASVPLAEVREVIHDDQMVEANYYYSYWVVPKDSPYQNLEELRGKTACFPSPLSSSGYVAPLGRLVELGFVPKAAGKEADAKSFFGNVIFGGGYQQCWGAVESGQADVTVIAGDVPEKLYREVRSTSRVLESQGPIPSHALVVSKDLQEPMRSRLIQALIAVGEEDRGLMRSFVSGIFVGFQETSAAEHLEGLNRYLEATGLQFTERLG